jgi:hypothetical protein
MAAVLHHVPPERGVTEIRVHGVGGTSAASLLEQTGVRQLTGDEQAGMFRGTVEPAGRAVEAYSWGGLTARGRSRAFWVVLLPFSLVNLAGWMVEPPREGGTHRTIGIRWHEAFVQVVALLTTAAYVTAAAMLAMDTVALQCGSVEACRDRHWYLAPLGMPYFEGHPGRRAVAGLAVPLLLLLGFHRLSVKSSKRYDDFGASAKDDVSADDTAGGSVLGLRDFWYPSDWQRALVPVHLAVPLLVLGGLLARSAADFAETFGGDVGPLGTLLPVVAAATLLAAVVAVMAATWWGGDALPAGAAWFGGVAWATFAVSVAVTGAAASLTWRLALPDARFAVPAGGGRVVPAWELWGFGWAPVVLLGAGAAFVGLFSVVQMLRWFAWRRWLLDQFAVVLMAMLVVLWPWAVPVAVGAAAVGVAAQWGPLLRSRWHDGAPGPALWRLWVFLGVCAATVVARLATGGAGAPWGTQWPRLTPVLLYVALLTAMVAAAAVVDASGARVRALAASVALPLALLGAGAGLAAWTDRRAWFNAAAALAWVALAIVWLARFRFDSQPRWRWNGPSAVATLALALVLGVFSGAVIRVVDHLGGGTVALRSTAFYEWVALGFAGVLLVLVAGAVVWGVALVLGVVVRDGVRVPSTERLCEAVRAGDVVVTMAALLLGLALGALGQHLLDLHGLDPAAWMGTHAPDGWRDLVDAASWVAVGVAFATLLAIRRGLRDAQFRVKVGIVWDLVTFWPRSFHPFAPPAYATRAVPEVQARLAEVVAGGGAAVLSAHSQGSVIGLAAVASLKPAVRRRVVLVTHGSPISRFYERYFPRYFPTSLFDHCAATLGWAAHPGDGAWLNFWRRTDPIADPVFAGRTVEGTPHKEVLAAVGTSYPDVESPDPLPRTGNPYVLPAKPPLRRHSGYMADPVMVRTIDALAAQLLQ